MDPARMDPAPNPPAGFAATAPHSSRSADLVLGDEAVKIMIRGRARVIRAFWDKAVLVVETKSQVSSKQRRLEDRWLLDEDGEWLTIERLHEMPGGPARQRLRLQRRT